MKDGGGVKSRAQRNDRVSDGKYGTEEISASFLLRQKQQIDDRERRKEDIVPLISAQYPAKRNDGRKSRIEQ